MRKELSWKKGAFSSNYLISNFKKVIGSLKVSVFTSHASGEINGDRYTFQSQGVLSRTIHVFKKECHSYVASIKVNFWGSQANVRTSEKEYTWRFRNIWQTKWSLADDKQVLVSGTTNGLNLKGNIAHKGMDDLLVLISLYLKNYMMRRNSSG